MRLVRCSITCGPHKTTCENKHTYAQDTRLFRRAGRNPLDGLQQVVVWRENFRKGVYLETSLPCRAMRKERESCLRCAAARLNEGGFDFVILLFGILLFFGVLLAKALHHTKKAAKAKA